MPEIIFTAIVGGLSSARLPLGGGATVLNGLLREWSVEKKTSLTVLGIGADASQYPSDVSYSQMPLDFSDGANPHALTHLSTFQYASIARQFESATTEWLLERAKKSNPRKTCIICNDISEGVDFRRVAEAGYPIITIFNVDVVDFFTRFYFYSLAKPETLTRWHCGLSQIGASGLLPDVLKLVFQKQADCVRHSKRVIVPSTPMKENLLRCYPWKTAEEIVVVPWGATDGVAALLRSANSGQNDSALRRSAATTERERIRAEFELSDNDFILLTLSRLSREKGLDALLRALFLWEKSGDKTTEHVRLFICGEAAYMGGKKYKRKLQQLASRLQKVRVHFVGHVDGARKHAFFEVADLFVMPSYHESYGLTLVEAMRAGLPVLTSNHYSAAEIVGNISGQIVQWKKKREAPLALKNSLARMLVDKKLLRQMGFTAQQKAAEMRFSGAAVKIKKLVEEVVS